MRVNNYVFVSDLHCGDQLGLYPVGADIRLDEGGRYEPNTVQRKMWKFWKEFWTKWVPVVTKGEPYGIVVNGDLLDGVHHDSVTQITHNLTSQSRIAYEVLSPLLEAKKCKGGLFVLRGTEAHGGKSGQQEEALAFELGAHKDKEGRSARWELWLKVGDGLVHALHHIGVTGSQAYEATAVQKELTESYVEAARWGERPPDIIIRAHRHRYIKTEVATERGRAQGVVLPGWQGKTPFAFKVAGARLSLPQFGGVVVRQGDREFFTLHKVWSVRRDT